MFSHADRRERLALLLSALLCAGCGSNGGGGGSFGGGTPVTTPTTLVLDLATGVLAATADGTRPGDVPATALLFRRVNPQAAIVGSDSSAMGAQGDEGQRQIIVSTFYVAACELTQRQWQTLAGTSPWLTVAPSSELGVSVGADRPAFALSFDAVNAALTTFNASTRPFLLRRPGNDEWEVAARGGTGGPYPWGVAEDAATVARFASVRETQSTVFGLRPVATRAANGYGLFDVAGNAWEWVADGATTTGNVVRGGSWSDNLISARCANRQYIDPAIGHALAGVRLAIDYR